MNKRVLIIGAGVIGCCTGYYLAQRGCRVTLVDQGDADRQGCSFGNAGLVVPSHFVPLAAPGMLGMALRMMLNSRSPFYIQPRWDPELISWGLRFCQASTAAHVARSAPLLRDLNMASRACYEQLSEIPGHNFGLVREGLLMLCKTPKGLEEEIHAAEQANRLGIPAKILDTQQLAAMEPGITMDVAGAVYFPMDCHLSPGRLMAVLRKNLTELDAEFRWNTCIGECHTRDGKIEAARATGGEEFEADEYVLCGGSWSPKMARALGLKLPMQPGKGYSLTLPRPHHRPRISAILTEARVAVTPMGEGLRFGGTMEMSGLNHEIRPNRVEGIVRSVPAYYPQFTPEDFANITPWCGLRPCSPDGLPYIGRTKSCKNLSIATGHAMMGISLGPITGKLIAESIAGEQPEIDIRLLDPDRYSSRRFRNSTAAG
jgi:D-amino-acid dehydrogenase